MKCVKCGAEATAGNMRHPYCQQCYTRLFHNNYGEYLDWLELHHGEEHHKQGDSGALTSLLFMVVAVLMLMAITAILTAWYMRC